MAYGLVFSSYIFLLVFLPITLAGFACARRLVGSRGAAAWLILASLVFYAAWALGGAGHPSHLVLLVGSIATNYMLGRWSARARVAGANRGWGILTLAVTLNLLLLAYFKYADFFARQLNDLVQASVLPEGWALPLPGVVLPLAISFFTFQQIAYQVDVYRGKVKDHRVLDYLLFVAFFPQLIAGPIVHHAQVLPQFRRLGVIGLHPRNLAVGSAIFVIGLSKKVLIADEFALIADAAFQPGAALDTASAWAGALAYTLQIYFDFSGYSDMAIGLGRMFGVRLPENFNSPYKATSVVEFWRRWHITLSRFLRDYLYIPLGGNRHGVARRHINLMLTMLLGGLWHGAGWTFVFWGGLHGLYLIINHGWRHLRKKHGRDGTPSFLGHLLAGGVTFLAVMLAWVFFRAESFGTAWAMLGHLVGLGSDSPEALSFDSPRLLLIAAGLAFVWLLPNTQSLMYRERPICDRRPEAPRSSLLVWRARLTQAVCLSWLALFCLMQISRGTAFIYYQF